MRVVSNIAMRFGLTRLTIKASVCAIAFSVGLSARQANRPAQLPDAPGRDTVKKVCGACHPAELVLGKGMTREQWGSLVSNMVSRGAKGTDAEFAEILDYLSANLPPHANAAAPGPHVRKGGGGLLAQAGPADKQVVDEEAAKRGKAIYAAQCVTCHGTEARGTDHGADLVRSLVVLKDRYGDTIGPFLQKGHPMQSGEPAANLTKAQIEDLSDFLHQSVEDTLRTGPHNTVLNVLTGDVNAGKAFFNGKGKCDTCHSPTGDLAGIASKYDPPTLQLKTIFPETVAFGRRGAMGNKKPVTVTVTPPNGAAVTGELVYMDDFYVSLRDQSGDYKTFKRTPELKVEKHDPYAAHIALLDEYTNKDMHDVVAYLETLK